MESAETPDTMSSSAVAAEQTDDPVYHQYREVCLDMNMDNHTTLSAWHSYIQVKQHYSLEGNRLHWLACALYVASRNGQVPTVTPHRAPVQGNFISLTRLLRSCRLSLLEFFDKSVKWADMSNMPVPLRMRLDTLQRSFAVTMFLFNNYYEPIFRRLFGDPSTDTPRAPKSRKQHRARLATPCNRADLFRFTWTLFVLVKWQTGAATCDLVSTYHLLLACVDFVFGTALADGRKDLVRADSGALPDNWSGASDEGCPLGGATGADSVDSVSILEFLCRNFDGLIVEVKGVRQHSLRERLTALYSAGILHGCPPGTRNRLGQGLLADSDAFDASCKSMNKCYEEYLLTCGNFDERTFLGERALEQIGLPSRTNNYSVTAGDLAHRIMVRRSLMMEHADPEPLVPATPLTGRGYLRASAATAGTNGGGGSTRLDGCDAGVDGSASSGDVVNGGLVYMTMQSVSRLQQLLAGRQARPSPTLQQLLTEATTATKSAPPTSASSSGPDSANSSRPANADELCSWMSSLVEDLGKLFVTACSEQLGGHSDARQLALRRFDMATTLYYRQLENIVVAEKMRRPNIDLMILLCQPIFHRCLLSCSLEMVLFSYNTGSLEFPWLLDALAIEPYDFYKLLEIVIREEHGLGRDIIKHLSKVEEQILDSMAWRTNSRLWHVIDAVQGRVPSSETVALPAMTSSSTALPSKFTSGATNSSDTIAASAGAVSTPLRGIRRLCMERPTPSLPQQSPLSSMASERFMSPVSSTARRRLFAATAAATPVTTATAALSSGAVTRAVTVTKAAHKRVLTFGADENSPVLVNNNNDNRADTVSSSEPVSLSVSSASAVSASQPSATSNTTTAVSKTKQNSLGLFFRKFYHLAWVRLRELSGGLDLSGEIRQTIWTVLEYVVVNHVDIMMGRHLDQLIMCSVFVVCKAFGVGKKFTDIMGQYRYQPQARSHVYRSVLLGVRPKTVDDTPPEADGENGASTTQNGRTSPAAAVAESSAVNGHSAVDPCVISASSSVLSKASVCPPTPSQLAGSATSYRYADRDEIRGDIIQFYNQVFVLRVKVFLGRFTRPGDERPPPLSPLPSPRHCSPLSAPRRVCSSVYVSPMKAPAPAIAAGWAADRSAVRSYSFSRSPTNDLRLINAMLNTPPPQQQQHQQHLASLSAVAATSSAATVVRLTPRDRCRPSSTSIVSPRVLHVLATSATAAAAAGAAPARLRGREGASAVTAAAASAANGKPQEKFKARLKRMMDHRQANVGE